MAGRGRLRGRAAHSVAATVAHAGAAALVWVVLLVGVADAAVNDFVGALRAHVEAADRLFLRVQPIVAYGQSRQVLTTPVPYAVEVPIAVPEGARLRLGLATRDTFLREELVGRADPIHFAVSIVRPSGETVVLAERTLAIRERVADRRWFDLDLDLGRFAGETAQLRLAAETPGKPTAPEKTFALWSRPYVVRPTAGDDGPNLLFITIDACRADHLGSYGYARPTTPALDRLASEGVRFAKAYTNAPMTVPSLSQIFTSRYFPSKESPTLVSSLFAAGFPRTKAIIHNPYLEYFLKLDARDSFDSLSSVQWRADRIAAKGLAWIDAQRGQRWALYLHVLDVHTPYRVRAPDGTRFADPAYRGPIGYGWGDVEGAQQGKYDDADRAQVVARYDSALRFVDDHLGRLLDALRERGLLDRTLVVLSADHGEELWDHGSFFHGVSLYDEQLHVPLIVRLPKGARAGTVVDTPVRSVDIVPTIVDALGAPSFPDFQGESLLPLIESPAGGAPREDFARAANMVYPQRFGLRTATHKLVLTQQPFAESLFDLVADPRERKDLIADAAMRPVLEDLRARLARYREPFWRAGFQVRAVAQPGATADVEVTISSNDNQMVANPDRVGGDRPDTLELARDGLTLTWRGPVGATPIGFRFDRAMRLRDDTGITVRVRADGVDLPPQAIAIGAGDAHPPASPFVYKITGPKGSKAHEEPPLLATAPPSPTAGSERVRVYLWRVLEEASASVATPPSDEKTRERLRALGYAE
jgi:hypothetical protein